MKVYIAIKNWSNQPRRPWFAFFLPFDFIPTLRIEQSKLFPDIYQNYTKRKDKVMSCFNRKIIIAGDNSIMLRLRYLFKAFRNRPDAILVILTFFIHISVLFCCKSRPVVEKNAMIYYDKHVSWGHIVFPQKITLSWIGKLFLRCYLEGSCFTTRATCKKIR